MFNYTKLFKPKSIALVGASTKKSSVGRDILRNLIEANFKGKIFPVNPKTKQLMGLKCYSNLDEIKEKIDLVIIVIPAKSVLDILKQAAKLKIKAAIIISSGFKEVGEIMLEEEIKKICWQNDITLIGPNCLGIINPIHNLNASFAATSCKKGNIAFISQSGALCTSIIDSAKALNLGFSKFISLGNKAVVKESDLLNYFAHDKNTDIVAIYSEDLSNSVDFLKACQLMAKNYKPIIILKGARSNAGAGASASHTGALAGDDNLYQALFRQGNVIVANTTNQLFDYLQIFSHNKIKSINNLAILTNAGGPGVLAVDSLDEDIIKLASFKNKTFSSLAKNLPNSASLGNPVDILGDAKSDRYRKTLEILASDKKIDSLLFIFTPQSMSEMLESAKALVDHKNSFKIIIAVFMGYEISKEAKDYLRSSNIATFSFPEDAVKALVGFSAWQKNLKNISLKSEISSNNNVNLVRKIIDKNIRDNSEILREDEAFSVLSAYNIKTVKNFFVKEKSELNNFKDQFKGDLVLKISSSDIIHKTEAKGIELNVKPNLLNLKYDKLISRVKKNRPDADISGVLLTEMIKDDNLEMIIGSFRDQALGPALMLGFGGVYVEVFKDKTFALNPLSINEAKRMLDSLKITKILDGIRGKEAYDKEAIITSLIKLNQLMLDFPEISEVDINPLLVFKKNKGIKAVDARIIIK